jgi:hypothetical protein
MLLGIQQTIATVSVSLLMRNYLTFLVSLRLICYYRLLLYCGNTFGGGTVMTYHIPEEVIAKANKAYKDSPLPGQDAMASALRAIKDDLWTLIVDEYKYQN